MKAKKAFSLLCALSLLSLCGCSDEFSEADHSITDNSSSESQASDTEAPDKDSTAITDTGVSVTLDQNGKLDIKRYTPSSTPMGADGTWTIFVYLCGTDLESEGGFATIDIQEMLEASTGSNVKFVVQTGGTALWENEIVTSNRICRYEISEGEIYLLDEQPDASMGSADTLSDFLKWGVQSCPAAKMGLIFWNHGGGSISGVCFDELYDNDSLSLREIDSALSSASASMTDKFEFIGFDACLMGTIEAANVLATYSRYMYGSEETEPGYGWDYAAIGNYLGDDPDADGAALGKVVCDSFYDGCAEIYSESGATLSVIDLSVIDDVIVSFNDYAGKLYEASADNSALSAFVRNVMNADNFGGNNKSEGYTNMVDLAGIVNSGSEYADDADKVLSAIENAVIYKRNGSDHPDACGLSSYYPLELQGSAELKVFGDVAVSPYYLSLIDRTVYGNTNSGNTENYDNSSVLDLWLSTDETDDYYDYWDEYGECGPTGESPLIEFYDPPQLLDDGTFGFSLTDESLEYTASVQANVYMLSDDMEDLIELGLSVDIIPDWDNGVFTDNFDGYWFSLPDGQILAVYVVDECLGYDIYTSPVIINGEETNLRITHDYINGTVAIDGIWDGIDENGMAARNVYELSSGDRITPIYYALSIESGDEFYYYGEEYVFDGDPEIIFDILYDGEYLYGFTIDDIFGDYYITDYVNFSIDGENIYYSDLS
ncbi:MAG: clostripain-related cysteine peptidase [Huintestinicola sp.]